MSVRRQQAVTRPQASERRPLSCSLAEALLRRMLRGLRCGQLIIDTPAGERLVFQGEETGLRAQLRIHHWRCLRHLLIGSDIGFAESYIAGEWSSSDLADLLRLASHNEGAMQLPRWFSPLRVRPKLCHALNRNTPRGSRRNIAAHYDLGNDFFRLWLDAGMTYSSGLFSSMEQTLEDAQHAKLDRVIDLLSLSGREKVLEIGCGWGSLAERITDRYDCAVTAITLSGEQLAYARQRLPERCDVLLQDYREVRGTFDRIVSVEMLEAVGEAYWPSYFEKLRDSLRPGGIVVMQVITIDDARFVDYRRMPDFVQTHIFPGGMLPTTRIIEHETARAGLRLVTSEFFGEGYAQTLAHWHARFNRAWPTIERLGYDNRFRKTWEYYLAYCQAGFETGIVNVGLYQLKRAAE